MSLTGPSFIKGYCRRGQVFFKQMSQWLEKTEKTVLVWTILGLAIVGFIQVISRYVFNYSFTWYEELGRYLGVFVTFLGAAAGVRGGSHFAMDLFVTKLRRPWQQLLQSCTSILSGTFCLLVVFYSWKVVKRLYGYETTSPTMEIPMYLAYLPIPVFSLLMGVRYYQGALLCLLDLRKGGPELQEVPQ